MGTWGLRLRTHYTYAANLRGGVHTQAGLNWTAAGSYVPARKLTDDSPSERLVVADVAWDPVPPAWGTARFINHSSDGYSQDYQNHAFIDGHVSGTVREPFLSVLSTGNYSVVSVSGSLQSLWYWGKGD